MSFTGILGGDPVLASVVMANFRHVNFGSDLLPVNSSGVSVDDTLNLGSSSKRWANLYTKKLSVYNETILVAYLPSNITMDNDKGPDNRYLFNTDDNEITSVAVARGGFTGFTGGAFTIPENGLYYVEFSPKVQGGGITWETRILNGTTIIRSLARAVSENEGIITISTISILNSGDVINFWLNNIGTDRTLYGGIDATLITIRKIGAV